MLGDSVLLGAKDQLTAELEASGYTVDYRASAAEMIHQGNKALPEAGTPVGETVVVGLGHNSLWERDRANYDKWARKFNGEADELIQTLESLGAKKIVWVTLREPSRVGDPDRPAASSSTPTSGTSRTSTSSCACCRSATRTSCSPTGPRCPTSPG